MKHAPTGLDGAVALSRSPCLTALGGPVPVRVLTDVHVGHQAPWARAAREPMLRQTPGGCACVQMQAQISGLPFPTGYVCACVLVTSTVSQARIIIFGFEEAGSLFCQVAHWSRLAPSLSCDFEKSTPATPTTNPLAAQIRTNAVVRAVLLHLF